MHRANLTNLFVFLLLLSFSVLILGADSAGILNPARRTVSLVSVPIQGWIYNFSTTIKGEFLFFFQVRSIGRDYENLKIDYAKILAQTTKLKAVQEENNILRAQFESKPEGASKLLPARVIGFPKNLILDQGSNTQVKVGDIAVLENSFIGEVASVGPNSSILRIPTDPGSSISVYVDSPRGPKGAVVGNFGSTMVLEKILPEEKIEEGDLVLTAGEEKRGNIPKGLILGKISKISKDPSAVFQSAEVKPIWPYGDLRLVFLSSE